MLKGSRPFGGIMGDSDQTRCTKTPITTQTRTYRFSLSVCGVLCGCGVVRFVSGVYMSTHLEIRSLSSEMSSLVTFETVSLIELSLTHRLGWPQSSRILLSLFLQHWEIIPVTENKPVCAWLWVLGIHFRSLNFCDRCFIYRASSLDVALKDL